MTAPMTKPIVQRIEANMRKSPRPGVDDKKGLMIDAFGPMLQWTLSMSTMYWEPDGESGGVVLMATLVALIVSSTFGSSAWPLKRKQKLVGTCERRELVTWSRMS